MKYSYHDMYDQQFEDLVVEICLSILGIGVQGFCPGKDGGRDARFVGTANCFPDEQNPASGKFIVQSKHTSNPIAKFADVEFSSVADSSVISLEIPKIKKLVDNGELDHYILFANRRLSGDSNAEIETRIQVASGAKSVHLVGIEALERYLKRYREAAKFAHVEPVDSPLRVSPDCIANVMLGIKKVLEGSKCKANLDPIRRVSFQEKNKLNGLSPEYEKHIRAHHLKYFDQIRDFLAHPDNVDLLDAYDEAAEEFQLKIIAHRSEFTNFDRVLNYIIDRLLERDPDLKRNTRLTRTLVYYMYWNCDIGTEPEHAETDNDLPPDFVPVITRVPAGWTA